MCSVARKFPVNKHCVKKKVQPNSLRNLYSSFSSYFRVLKISLCTVNLIPKRILSQNPFFTRASLGYSFSQKKQENPVLQPVEEHITLESKEGPSGRSETHLWKSSPYWTSSFCRKVAMLCLPWKSQICHVALDFHEREANK